jgi:hypothetical protein
MHAQGEVGDKLDRCRAKGLANEDEANRQTNADLGQSGAREVVAVCDEAEDALENLDLFQPVLRQELQLFQDQPLGSLCERGVSLPQAHWGEGGRDTGCASARTGSRAFISTRRWRQATES